MPTLAALGQVGELFADITASPTQAVPQFRNFRMNPQHEDEDVTNNDSDPGEREAFDTFRSNSATFEMILDPAEPAGQVEVMEASKNRTPLYWIHRKFGAGTGLPEEAFYGVPRVTVDYTTTATIKAQVEINIRGGITETNQI